MAEGGNRRLIGRGCVLKYPHKCTVDGKDAYQVTMIEFNNAV